MFGIERLLDQKKSEEVGNFLDRTPPEHLFITDFSFHSIGIILFRLKETSAFIKFVRDTFLDGKVGLLRLEPLDMAYLVDIMDRFNLDFDDAYQYLVAEKNRLVLISFDGDFDGTERGRKLPEQVI